MLLSFLVEMDINESEAAQMETKAYQEAKAIRSKEAEAHSLESETQLKQKGLENSQNTGVVHNGEY